MTQQVPNAYPYFTDQNGKALDLGFVYIGAANQDPVANPIAVYWDDAKTIAATQPLRTAQGYIYRSGSPANVYPSTDGAFSIRVTDRNGRVIYTATSVRGIDRGLRADLAAPGGSALVGFQQSGSGAADYRTVEDELRDWKSATQFDGVDKTGATDSTAGLVAALAASNDLYLPDGDYLSGPLTLTGKRLHGPGRLIPSTACAATAFLTLNGSTLEGVKIHASTYCLYAVLCTGTNDKVHGVQFSGDVGHYVLGSGANKPDVHKCTVKEGYDQTTPFVFDNCTSPKANENSIEEHTGFGIQFRFCTDSQANSNRISQRVFYEDFTAATTTQTFALTTGRSCMRFAAVCNGVFLATTVTTVSDTEYSVTVSGLTVGQSVRCYGFVGLESIQFNSGCNGGTAVGNTVKGNGDSAILVGADYHWNGSTWVLDPTAVVKADYPRNITIANNPITGPIHAAGVALNNAVGCIVDTNPISDVGYIHDQAYQAGVSLGLIHDCVVNGNTTEGNGHTVACVKYTGSASTSNYSSYEKPSRFANNKGYNGAADYALFPTTSSTARRVGFDIDGVVDDTITRAIDDMLASSWTTGAYTGSRLAVTVSGAAGITKDATVTYADYTSLITTAGQYADFGIPAAVHNIFAGNICKVSFWAKADVAGNTGYVQLYYDFAADDVLPPFTVDLTNTTWQFFQFEMAIGDVQGLFLRIGGTTGVVRLSKLRIDAVKV